MEERGIPFHLAGPTALFQRAEVRDAIAWLRVLADPDDSAAAARALTRPPVELRPGDLARLTTIARRRKLDMVAGCEAALDSAPVPARGARAGPDLPQALQHRRGGDGGAPRRRLRAAADRGASACAASASSPPSRRSPSACSASPAWPSWRPPGRGASRTARPAASSPTSRAVAEAGVEPTGGEEPPAPGAVVGLALDAVKGLGFDHVFALGLEAEAEWAADRLARAHRAGALPRRRRRGPARPGRAYAEALAASPDAERGGARGGAVRPRRGPPRDLPDAARAGARGELAGGARAVGAAPRHRDRRQPGDRPLPRAAEAGGARPAARRGGGRRRRSRRSTGCCARSRRPSSRPSSTPPRSTPTCSTPRASAAAGCS